MLCSMNPGLRAFGLLFLIVLSCSPGHVHAAVVTLHSIQIYKTHDWLNKPNVYFQCKGENKTILPDVTKANTIYSFKGEESWQPLTKLSSKKCKRCGFYEKGGLLSLHDVFDEWELCPSDFTAPDGTYTHVKEKELNATFQCPKCIDMGADSHTAPSDSGAKGTSIALVILISAAVTIVVLVGFVGGYKYWQKRKRQQEQARFLKLFEEHDDMEDELGLGEII